MLSASLLSDDFESARLPTCVVGLDSIIGVGPKADDALIGISGLAGAQEPGDPNAKHTSGVSVGKGDRIVTVYHKLCSIRLLLGLLKVDSTQLNSAFSYLLNPINQDFGAYYVPGGDIAIPRGLTLAEVLNAVQGWDTRIPYRYHESKMTRMKGR